MSGNFSCQSRKIRGISKRNFVENSEFSVHDTSNFYNINILSSVVTLFLLWFVVYIFTIKFKKMLISR